MAENKNISGIVSKLQKQAKAAGSGDDVLRSDLANLRKDFESRTGRRQELETQFQSSKFGTNGTFDPSLKKELFDLRKSLPGMQSQIDAKQKQLGSSTTGQREHDVARGAEFGATVLGEGLGRLGEDTEVSEALQRFKGISETGLSSAESVAQREKALSGIDQATQTGLRGLQARLSASGVKGATAGQQLIQRELAGAQQKAETERDLFLQSEQVKREGLKEYSSRLGDVKTFDLAQAASEKDIILQAGLGFAQLGSSERTAQFAAERAKEASIAAAKAGRSGGCFALGTMVTMSNNVQKRIENINPGDILTSGTVVTGISRHLAEEQMYNFNGTLVSATHYVYQGGLWIKVEDSSAIKVDYHNKYVYNLFTDTGVMIINYSLFSDYDGFGDHEEVDRITLRRMNELVQTLPVREVR